jgi:ADP-heptose:LPS heptosyltransferase
MPALRISDPRQRAMVAAADTLLTPVAALRRLRRPAPGVTRLLCLRLERIGDLLMTLPALAELRAALPGAAIDLAVGSWNRELATAIAGVTRVETLDAKWLARSSAGSASPDHVAGRSAGLGTLALARHAARWRDRHYDLAINFEPDIRSNIVMAAAGAARTAGFRSGGGRAFLDVPLDYDPSAHTTDNAVRLVRRTLALDDDAPAPAPSLDLPESARTAAGRLLQPLGGSRAAGIHVSGGRAIKQWPEARFRDLAEWLTSERQLSIVLTGTPDERAQIDAVRQGLPADRVLDLSHETDLLTVAAVLQQLTVFVTGDTGPMHLAHAVGTPTVAVFGPSDPARYAPRGLRDQVVRVDLPCSPCNRIRIPPARCTGHTPDCLMGVETSAVMTAIDAALGGSA